jgi:hypothetical protein
MINIAIIFIFISFSFMMAVHSFASAPMSTSSMISRLTGMMETINEIEITEEHIDILLKTDPEHRIGKMSGSEWISMMRNGEGVPILFQGHEDRDNLFEDQMARDRSLVAEMMRRGIKKLRTMDGHGRMLTCFLLALQERGEDVDTYEIEVYEINPNAHTWHEHFFPQNVIAVDDDILESVPPADTMLYLNFCGIGEQIDDVKEHLSQIFAVHPDSKVMISFSIRGATINGPLYNFATSLKRRPYKLEYVSNRGNFYSGLVEKRKPDVHKRSIQDDEDGDEVQPSINPAKRRRTIISDDDDS